MLRRLPPTVLALFCMVLGAAAAYTQSGSTVDPKALYDIEGTVINVQTGRPIPHALVEIFGAARRAMLTDSEGRFTFEKLPQRSFSLSARKPGFNAPGAAENSPSFANISVGPQMGKVTLKLVPGAGLIGEVSDNEGEPLEGASIQLLAVRYIDGRRRMMPAGGNVSTDENGNFHVTGLLAGRYYLTVRPADRRREFGTSHATSALPAITYFPTSADLAGATPIDLVPGQREHVTLTVKRVPAFKLAGVITGVAAYKQVSPPMLVDDSGQPIFNANRWDSQTGAFEFPSIPAGTYSLQVYGRDHGDRATWLKEKVMLDKNLTDLALNLEPGLNIALAVRVELGSSPGPHFCSGGFPTQQGDVLECSKMSAMANLMAVWPGQVDYSAQPLSKDDPSLVFNGVAPGQYIVRVTPMVAAHVHSIRSGGVDLLQEPLTVAAGTPISPIEVVLRDDGGSVRIRVRSASIPDTGRLLLFPEFAPNLPPTNLDISPTGEREYGGLPPGSYRIFAFDSIDGLEYSNPEAMAKYQSKAATVTITANGSVTATVDLIHTGE
jgi:Carboxypeptidase regulatory-like domain/Prealbumin-like fold domain